MLLLIARFNSPRLRYPELFLVCHGAQPEAVGASVVMTSAATMAFYEGRGAEVLQAGAWG